MYWTEAWIAILTAGLAFAFWLLWRAHKRLDTHDELLLALDEFKADKRQIGKPRPRAWRVKPTKPLYDFGSGECIGHECPECGARVAEMGHTVAACEERQAEIAGDDAELEREMKEAAAQTAAEDATKATHEVATSGLETPGVPQNK